VRLPDAINFTNSVFSPAVASDGSIYFMAATGEGGKFQLYCSQFQNRAYQPAKPLSFSPGKFSDVDLTVAPDQSFIVFSSNRPPESQSLGLFIVYRKHGVWGEPVDLGSDVNSMGDIIEAKLGPDGHTLYFANNFVVPPAYPKSASSAQEGLRNMQSWNNGLSNIWKIDLAPWLSTVHEPVIGNAADALPKPGDEHARTEAGIWAAEDHWSLEATGDTAFLREFLLTNYRSVDAGGSGVHNREIFPKG